MSDEYEAGGVLKMLSSVCEELRFVGAYSTDVPLGKDILFVHCLFGMQYVELSICQEGMGGRTLFRQYCVITHGTSSPQFGRSSDSARIPSELMRVQLSLFFLRLVSNSSFLSSPLTAHAWTPNHAIPRISSYKV